MKINELLAEEKKDKYCSDKCCGSDVKAEDCKCPPTCKHCNCNDPTVSETATAGATSAGNIASVANPIAANAKIKRDKKGVPVAPQKKNKDGTAQNALDLSNNLMGGKTIKR
jgi:hypothetical protein